MAKYISLDEAAKSLGVSAEELVEMRTRGEIFGFRDGSSWKFKTDEIERVVTERSGEVLGEESGGSSILLSERSSLSGKSGSILTGDSSGSGSGQSDLRLEPEEEDSDSLLLGSDVALIPDPNSGSGVRLVNRGSPTPPLGGPADDDDDMLRLEDEDDSGEMEIDASSLSLGPGSDKDLGSDMKLAADSNASKSPPLVTRSSSKPGSKGDSDVLAGSDLRLLGGEAGGTPDLIQGDSDADIELGSGLELLSIGDDDLVLGSGSDLGLGADSGINLMSPSDSGLSLEDDEPMDLAGTGISGLDLGAESGGSDVSGSDPKSGIGSGISGIDFAAAEDFQLSPSGGMDLEEDSGSQVIEIEDSSELGDPLNAPSGQDAFGMPENGDSGYMEDAGLGMGAEAGVGAAGAGAYRGAPEVPLAGWEVATLLCIVLFMGMSGILVTDIVRNMWSWNGESAVSISSWFTKMIVDSVGWEG